MTESEEGYRQPFKEDSSMLYHGHWWANPERNDSAEWGHSVLYHEHNDYVANHNDSVAGTGQQSSDAGQQGFDAGHKYSVAGQVSVMGAICATLMIECGMRNKKRTSSTVGHAGDDANQATPTRPSAQRMTRLRGAGPTTAEVALLSYAQSIALNELSNNNSEIFFNVMRKVHYLAEERGVRCREVFKSNDLLTIYNMVPDVEVNLDHPRYQVGSNDESDSDDESSDEEQDSDEEKEEANKARRIAGIVDYYNDARGYGNICIDYPDRGVSDDYFFHVSQVDGGKINVGDDVLFYQSYNEGKDRWEAKDIIFLVQEDD